MHKIKRDIDDDVMKNIKSLTPTRFGWIVDGHRRRRAVREEKKTAIFQI